MAAKNLKNVESKNKLIQTVEQTPVSPDRVSKTGQLIDPQVKATRHYTQRRLYDAVYKVRMLIAYDACDSASERGELLRREGLYHSRICAWKHEQAKGKLKGGKHQKGLKGKLRVDHLQRENEQLKKKLAHAEAIISLQKKISELLGVHILPHDVNEI